MTGWQGCRVFITGHTGFKGSWLALTLARLGAQVFGYSLPAATSPALYELAQVKDCLQGEWLADVRDQAALHAALSASQPQVIFHLAAQALVSEGYQDPLGTFSTNVMGVANVLEASRHQPSVAAVVVVTSDKCYLNREWLWGYREDEALGGKDPYSASKAAAEIVAACWRQSFTGPAIATARAGNVIGGGDWARDRIVPDAVRAFSRGEALHLRRPEAVRPWQHVLEPIAGYMLLAQACLADRSFAEAWNFGPDETACTTVGELCTRLEALWGSGHHTVDPAPAMPEAGLLKLDSARARAKLGWAPRWTLDQALQRTVSWYRAELAGQAMRAFTESQIEDYFAL